MNRTYIAILRGINVSGQKIIKMEVLKLLYMELGFQHVQTFIQSGNVIFQSSISESGELESIITRKIEEIFNFYVPVIVLAREELKLIIENNPYAKIENIDVSLLHVTFLSELPASSNIDKLQHITFENDEFFIENKAIYLYIKGGYGKTKLSNNFFESKLKVKATTRNWKTTCELLKLAEISASAN
jgi:uncharacterized protein (DUF1697 family)